MAAKRGLGRGISELIPTDEPSGAKGKGSQKTVTKTVTKEVEKKLKISEIEPNKNQPRKHFNEDALNELAESIKQVGMIEPIVVIKRSTYYEIIAGERRWRASQMAGLTSIPAYIRTADDESVMELALVENIQREDLNAIEIALAYEHLAEASGMTQEKISERVGKSRTAVTNYMRLLKLPAQIQMALKNHEIDMGHARALLSLDSPSMQLKLFRDVQKNQYSVRKVEEMVQALKNGEDVQLLRKRIATNTPLSDSLNEKKQYLSDRLKAKVQLSCTAKGNGKISIAFTNEDDLNRILSLLGK